MHKLEASPNRWDPEKCECKAIIETPKGRRSKFHYDPEFAMFALGAHLPEGLVFPYDFGFIPSTVGGDGDPLDLMILMDEPAHVGCLVDVRIIGVIEADQTEKDGETMENHRLIAVAVHSYSRDNLKSIDEVSPRLLDEVEDFFVFYNQSRGKQFRPKGRFGPERAAEHVDRAIKDFQKASG